MEVKCKLFSGREAAAPGHRALWRNWIAPSRSVVRKSRPGSIHVLPHGFQRLAPVYVTHSLVSVSNALLLCWTRKAGPLPAATPDLFPDPYARLALWSLIDTSMMRLETVTRIAMAGLGMPWIMLRRHVRLNLRRHVRAWLGD